MTPSRRMDGVRAYDRAADAYGTVAWKAPSATRFTPEVANDPAIPEPGVRDMVRAVPEPGVRDMVRAVPGWAVVVGGGVVAALMGLLLGGALHI